jgi:hypothetical protein
MTSRVVWKPGNTLWGSRTRPPVLTWALGGSLVFADKATKAGRHWIRSWERSAGGWSGRAGGAGGCDGRQHRAHLPLDRGGTAARGRRSPDRCDEIIAISSVRNSDAFCIDRAWVSLGFRRQYRCRVLGYAPGGNFEGDEYVRDPPQGVIGVASIRPQLRTGAWAAVVSAGRVLGALTFLMYAPGPRRTV